MIQNRRKRIDLIDDGVALAGTAESDSGAGPLLIAARDMDTLRFRADTGINKAIRQTASDLAERGVLD